MRLAINPEQIRAPFAKYSHAVAVNGAGRLLFASGQLGMRLAGEIPEGAEEQAAICFSNIDEILRGNQMSRADVVRINAYVTGREHLAGYMAARDRWIERLDPPPASTLLIANGFTLPEFKVEVEITAAR